MRVWLPLLLLTGLAGLGILNGCDSGDPAWDAGTLRDAGPLADTGPLPDAGPQPDAGPRPDAGPPPDAGPGTAPSPRNAGEVTIPGSGHPLGEDLIASFTLPEGASAASPVPACVLVHGSGGLFREGDYGDPCTEAIEPRYAELIALLEARGVATLAPSSFYSRDPRFCEDNSSFIDFAPAGYNRDAHRIALRTYDLIAATAYLCAREEIDCSRLCFVGTSNGGSILFHYLHHELEASFASFFEREAAEIGALPYVPIPADRPMPRFAQAISPGCGLNGAIGLEADPGDLEVEPLDQLYYPAEGSELFMDLGSLDSVPDECALAVGDGRREVQAGEVERRLGIDPAASRYGFTVHEGGEHDLLGQDPFGDTIRATFLARVDAMIGG